MEKENKLVATVYYEADNGKKYSAKSEFSFNYAEGDVTLSENGDDNAVYIESWGPEYHGSKKIKLGLRNGIPVELSCNGTSSNFSIKASQTIVEWYFKNKMDAGNVEAFDGMSLIEWTPDGKIALLKEFGCNENRYDPYKDGNIPHFRDENAKWF